MAEVHIRINGREYSVPEEMTVLEAAGTNGIYVPTLCAYEGMKPRASCRLCIVTIDGEDKEKLACATRVREGMSICTDSEDLFKKRKATVQELFRQHTVDCHHCLRIGSTKAKDFDPGFCKDCYFCDCVRDGFCELQAKALEFGVDELPFDIQEYDFAVDDSTGSIIHNPNKCIQCRRCVEICKAQGVGILGMVRTEKGVSVGAKNSLKADGCVRCGRCVDVCPTGAFYMKEHKDEEIYYAHCYTTQTAAMVSPGILPELERLFKAPEGSFTLEKIADGLKKIGIDNVFDSSFAVSSSRARAAELLDGMLGKRCALLATDYAAKCFLQEQVPHLAEHFVFPDSAQEVFGGYMHTHHPNVRLYSIAERNSFGAEAAEQHSCDYFLNPRELYRVFMRTGVNPSLRRGIAAGTLCDDIPCERYKPLLDTEEWMLNGEMKELTFKEKGREVKALVCCNLGQVHSAVEKLDSYDIIRVIG